MNFQKHLKGITAAALVSLLAACAAGSNSSIKVVQTESQIVTAALVAGATSYAASPAVTPVQAAEIKTAVTELQAVNSTIQGTQDFSTLQAAAVTLSTDVTAVLQVYPANPATVAIVDAAVAALTAAAAASQPAPTTGS